MSVWPHIGVYAGTVHAAVQLQMQRRPAHLLNLREQVGERAADDPVGAVPGRLGRVRRAAPRLLVLLLGRVERVLAARHGIRLAGAGLRGAGAAQDALRERRRRGVRSDLWRGVEARSRLSVCDDGRGVSAEGCVEELPHAALGHHIRLPHLGETGDSAGVTGGSSASTSLRAIHAKSPQKRLRKRSAGHTSRATRCAGWLQRRRGWCTSGDRHA